MATLRPRTKFSDYVRARHFALSRRSPRSSSGSTSLGCQAANDTPGRRRGPGLVAPVAREAARHDHLAHEHVVELEQIVASPAETQRLVDREIELEAYIRRPDWRIQDRVSG